MSASTGGHYRGHCRREIAGVQDKIREEQIPEQRHMVNPSVARGYRLWYRNFIPSYTWENRQGG
ncbi:unnamed protein product [Staurois parvus]|uniref:Uncharacterized protein n=1 Tax=Staurois parvus TaxID=386267 RepID=A0ABN9DTF7_9NEOB|nr:unnamed protein product [Staurois parvus]